MHPTIRSNAPTPRRWRDRLAGWLLSALAAAAGLANAAPCDLPAAKNRVSGAYTVTCSGKSECQVSDMLEIKPQGSGAKALASVCLLLGDGTKPVSVDDLPVHDPAVDKSVPTSYALAPHIERWLADKSRGHALRQATTGKLPVDVVLVDSDGKRYVEPLLLNLTSLWNSGAIGLAITKIECTPNPCRLGGTLTLTVPNLAAWQAGTQANPAKLDLMLDTARLPAATNAPVPSVNSLAYPLLRLADKPDNVAAWSQFLPTVLGDHSDFSVGLVDEKGHVVRAEDMPDPKPGRPSFSACPWRASAFWIGLVLLLVVLSLIGLKTKFRWLRDDYELPPGITPAGGMPFSLGRSQMLWWTVVVFASWLAVAVSTGEWAVISDASLTLMGVGAGTFVGAALAGVPKAVSQCITAYQKAQNDVTAAETGGDAPTLALTQARDTAKIALTNLVSSKRWWADISSDYGEDTGLHRVQSVLFTVAFGGWVLCTAYFRGSMPVLSAQQLALLGISGGVYVGFKMTAR